MTQGIAALELSSGEMMAILNRHLTGDWGDLDEEDKQRNDAAVKDGTRVFSSYNLTGEHEGIKVWVITEWDRSVTTFLLPSEY